MPEIRMEHKTKLSADEIKKKMNGFMVSRILNISSGVPLAIEEAFSQFNVKISNTRSQWEGNNLFFSFKAKGMRILGKVIVENQLITVEAKIPVALGIFRDRIINEINRKAKELFP